jgi:hypothetical protein
MVVVNVGCDLRRGVVLARLDPDRDHGLGNQRDYIKNAATPGIALPPARPQPDQLLKVALQAQPPVRRDHRRWCARARRPQHLPAVPQTRPRRPAGRSPTYGLRLGSEYPLRRNSAQCVRVGRGIARAARNREAAVSDLWGVSKISVLPAKPISPSADRVLAPHRMRRSLPSG